jgi:hypothetical protein
MLLEAFARFATTALLSRSGFRIFGGIECGDYTEASERSV